MGKNDGNDLHPIKEVTECSAFYNIDAENAVIGATLIKPSACIKYFKTLLPSDFYDPENQRLAAVILALIAEDKQIDTGNLNDAMMRLYGNNDAFIRAAHNNYVGTVASVWSIKEHVKIVKDASFRRGLYKTLEATEAALKDATLDASAVHEKLRQDLRDMRLNGGHKWISLGDVAARTMSMLERKAKGEDQPIPSGIASLDNLTTGLHRGELTVLAARPSIGKSALGMHMALEAARRGCKVGIVSMEMTAEQYGLRVIARDTGIDNVKLRKGMLEDDDWAKIAESMIGNGEMNVNFIFTARTVEDLRSAVQEIYDDGGIDLLVVDYMQLMQSQQKFEKNWLLVGYVSKSLKFMTTDFNIPILALAQVGREANGTMPTLAELRGSGDIEQDADNVIFIHRPETCEDRYVPEQDRMLFNAYREHDFQYMVLNVAKNRQGRIGCAPVAFNPSRMHFTGIQRD